MYQGDRGCSVADCGDDPVDRSAADVAGGEHPGRLVSGGSGGRPGPAGGGGQVRAGEDESSPVGAENLRHLGRCFTGRRRLGHANGAWRAGLVRLACDDLRLVGLKLIFLVVTRAVSVLGLSRREAWWKDAEILMLRHQLAVALRERPRAHSRLTWPDRAWLALLAGTLPAGRLAAMRLIVTPGHDLAVASRHHPPPLGAAVLPRPLRTSAGAP